MANRAKISALVGVICLVGGALVTSQQTANAAAECVTEPRQEAPQGQHWYYHIDPSTKRHCWYLRDKDDTAAQIGSSQVSSSQVSSSQVTPSQVSSPQVSSPKIVLPQVASPLVTSSDEPVPAPKIVTRKSGLASRAVGNARAEFLAPQPLTAAKVVTTAPQAVPASQLNTTPVASSPFPDPPQRDGAVARKADTAPPAADTSSTPPALAAYSAAADPSPQATAAPAVAPDPPAVPASPAKSPAALSLQMLFVVILGALALAGLSASVVYRLARPRRAKPMDARQRRASIWASVDNPPKRLSKTSFKARRRASTRAASTTSSSSASSKTRWAEPVIEKNRPRPLLPQAEAQSGTGRERFERIEDILAQLVNQAQTDG